MSDPHSALAAATDPLATESVASPTPPATPAGAVEAISKARDLDELERIRTALYAVGECAYHWNIDSDRLEWSANAADVIKPANAELLASGRGYASLLDADNLTNRYETIHSSGSADDGSGVAYAIEYMLRPAGRDDDRVMWVEDHGRWFAGADGRPREAFGLVRRIDDRHERDQQLHQIGHCDPLTGLMNRGRMSTALDEAIARARLEQKSCGFMILAISNLSIINDAYGFEIADDVLVAVTQRLQDVMRGGDTIARYSGSKFGIILGNASDNDLAVAAERFMTSARDTVIETRRGPVWAMISVGGIVLPQHADVASAAVARAEEALSEARRLPSDAFVAYRPSPERVSLRSLNARCAAEIVKSLKDRSFTLAFQPIVNAIGAQPAMFEALLRMRCADDDEAIAATHLIPVAEKLGLVRLIDREVMTMAIDVLKSHPEARLSVNVSGTTATDPRWFGMITELLEQNSDLTSRLLVEITETVALNDLDSTVKFVNRLKELGCQVALDDFGAGYTSFRNLKLLDIDMVKIDGSFCRHLVDNRENQYFVRSLIDLAKKFDLKTIAEWIEEPSDAELLKSWGIDYLQGNLFGAAELREEWSVDARDQAPAVTAGDEPPVIASAAVEAEPPAATGVDTHAATSTGTGDLQPDASATPLTPPQPQAETASAPASQPFRYIPEAPPQPAAPCTSTHHPASSQPTEPHEPPTAAEPQPAVAPSPPPTPTATATATVMDEQPAPGPVDTPADTAEAPPQDSDLDIDLSRLRAAIGSLGKV